MRFFFSSLQICLTLLTLLVMTYFHMGVFQGNDFVPHGNKGRLVFLGLSSLPSTLSRLWVSSICGEEKR